MGRKRTQKRCGQAPLAHASFAGASPIQVSTPPVRIIGTGRRHRGGFRLSDR